MGFFSYECKLCKYSILSAAACGPCEGETMEHDNRWMSEAVVCMPNGSRLIGEYGGYGDIDGLRRDDGSFDRATWYHRACWEISGKPEYDGASEGARDQGWFFETRDYDHEDPRSCGELPQGSPKPPPWSRR